MLQRWLCNPLRDMFQNIFDTALKTLSFIESCSDIFAIIFSYICLIIVGYDVLKATLFYANPINTTFKFSIISKRLNGIIGLLFFYNLGFLVATNMPLHSYIALITLPFVVISITLIIVSYSCFYIKQKNIVKHQPLIPKSYNIKMINPIVFSLVMVWFGYVSNPIFTQLYNSAATEISNWMKARDTPTFRIDITNDSATITIPQFTIGIAGFNQLDWGELDIDEVIDELFHSLLSVKTDFDCKIYINLYYYDANKYGNKTFNGRIYELLTVSTAEVKRYKNSHYFEQNYDIINQITKLPFNKKPIKEWEQVLK